MTGRLSFLLVLTVMVLVLSVSMCGEENLPKAAPYKTLSYDRWVHRSSVVENGQTVNVTITIKFGTIRLYTLKQNGVVSGSSDELESFSLHEQGSYEITETEPLKGTITFMPNDGDQYTVQWQILPGEGNLELRYPDGRFDGQVIEFNVVRDANQ